MPARTDPFWRGIVKLVKAEHQNWGAQRIARFLIGEAIYKARPNPPSPRTVGRILREDWDRLSESDKAQYRPFRWPESMQSELLDLPWEATPVALEALADFYTRTKRRPHNRLVKWLWRVTLAVPDQEYSDRLTVAVRLASCETLGLMDQYSHVWEWFLAYAPWRSENARDAYEKAISMANDPAAPWGGPSWFGLIETNGPPPNASPYFRADILSDVMALSLMYNLVPGLSCGLE
jgi:hypothetical protein